MLRCGLAIAALAASNLTLVASIGPAFAQQLPPAACGYRTDMLAQLKDKYQEDPAGFGMTGNGAVVELMTSDGGSWTLILSFPNGRSCLMATGDGWELWKNIPRKSRAEKGS